MGMSSNSVRSSLGHRRSNNGRKIMYYKNNPEVVSSVAIVDADGEEFSYGDLVTGIQVMSSNNNPAHVQLDIRRFEHKGTNLVIEIPLQEFVVALSMATLNADKSE